MKLRLIPVILTAAITSFTTLYIAGRYQEQIPFLKTEQARPPVNFAGFDNNSRLSSLPPVDFQNAAESSIRAVVHVKTATRGRTVVADHPFSDLFGDMFGRQQYYMPPQQGSGSGVVFSPDGYIITNYHVVSGADQVTVTFNDRYTTQAKVVGSDASTDIAVLKVQEKDLPYMEFGNSDEVRLGQWVLAVGYPLTLDATVTAGIVSAKSRALGINRTQSATAIESFIQTDAAVNPGNSGGALVNTSGQLIGINSAIASPTGSYAGYSYAIPSNIVRKVANDLIRYGSVQRAFLGIEYLDRQRTPAEQLSSLGIDKTEGVYVAGVPESGGAHKAGIRKGDFITKINGVLVRTEPQLQEQLARYKPGDHISVTYLRDGREQQTSVQLRNLQGTTEVVRSEGVSKLLGASFRALTAEEKQKLGIKAGVVVTDLGNGALATQTNMRKGFVIVSANDRPVVSVQDLHKIINAVKGSLQLAGFYPGYKGMYYYGINNPQDAE